MRRRSFGPVEDSTPVRPDVEDWIPDLNELSPDLLFAHLVSIGHCTEAGVRVTDAGTPSTLPLDEPSVPVEPVAVDPIDPMPVNVSDSELRDLLARFLLRPTLGVGQSNVRPVPSQKSNLRFPDSPLYEGDPAGLEGWLTSVGMYLRANGVDLLSTRSVDIACMFLRGKALDWWSSQCLLVAAGQVGPYADWEEFRLSLIEAFRPVELTRRYTEELLSSAQGKLDMRTYVATFNAARARVPGALSDETLCLVFLKGVHSDLQQSIAVQKPMTLAEHFSLAVLLADLHKGVPTPIPKKTGQTPPTADFAAKRPTCTHCAKVGHTAEKCFQLHPDLKRMKGKWPVFPPLSFRLLSCCSLGRLLQLL